MAIGKSEENVLTKQNPNKVWKIFSCRTEGKVAKDYNEE